MQLGNRHGYVETISDTATDWRRAGGISAPCGIAGCDIAGRGHSCAFCGPCFRPEEHSGIATESQKKQLLPTLRKMYEDMLAQAQIPESSADNALNWSSFVLPYLESVWSSGDSELASKTVENICERIYASMDRRVLHTDAKAPRLGWPGTSCEIWGAH